MLAEKIETKHTLFDNLEDMLAPETLSELLSQPITKVERQPMENHGGLAGSKLSYVKPDSGRIVLKQMSVEFDYLMYASDDQKCRSVTLWQFGLLDELQPHLEHKIIAGSRDGDGWALLMADLSDHIFTSDKPITPELVLTFLDNLAMLHATYWNDPRLLDPRLGLSEVVTSSLNVTSPSLAQKQNGDQRGVVPGWIREGWKILPTLLEPDVYAHIKNLHENSQPLLKAISRYPYTLVHGDYAARNLAFADHPVAFDWQAAGPSLMTLDLIHFTENVQEATRQEPAINYYRSRLETYLDSRFDDSDWQAMIDLGNLAETICLSCAHAYLSKHVDDPNWRRFFEKNVKKRSQQALDEMRWL